MRAVVANYASGERGIDVLSIFGCIHSTTLLPLWFKSSAGRLKSGDKSRSPTGKLVQVLNRKHASLHHAIVCSAAIEIVRLLIHKARSHGIIM